MNMEWWQEFLINYQWVFAVVATFTAASLAQMVSHVLSMRREEEKYLKECYQNFYAPILFKVLMFLQAHKSGVVLKLTKDEIFNEILNLFDENLKYASPELIRVYEDVRGNGEINSKIKLCFIFLERVDKVSKELKIRDKSNEIIRHRALCGIWLLVSCFFTPEIGYGVMTFSYELDEKKLNKKTLKKINMILKKKAFDTGDIMMFIAKELIHKNLGKMKVIQGFKFPHQILIEICHYLELLKLDTSHLKKTDHLYINSLKGIK